MEMVGKHERKILTFNTFSLLNKDILVMFLQYPRVRQCVCPPYNVSNYWTDLHEHNIYITLLYATFAFFKIFCRSWQLTACATRSWNISGNKFSIVLRYFEVIYSLYRLWSTNNMTSRTKSIFELGCMALNNVTRYFGVWGDACIGIASWNFLLDV
jgi:hypothetical protein